MRGKMQITDVRVRKITKEGKMRAIVSITLDDEFVIHDIKGSDTNHYSGKVSKGADGAGGGRIIGIMRKSRARALLFFCG